MTNLIVTISDNLEHADLPLTGSFGPKTVIDLRCEKDGSARPIEETVLKRLRNRFVEYKQTPMLLDEAGPVEEMELCDVIKSKDDQVLVLTDNVSRVATLMNLFRIPFQSTVFYVVETGKGNVVRPIDLDNHQVPSAVSA